MKVKHEEGGLGKATMIYFSASKNILDFRRTGSVICVFFYQMCLY